MRPLRRRKSGSETPKLQSMSYGDAQTLRSVFPAPLRDARLPLQRSQLLRLLARHGLKFWSLRPRLPTTKWSQFLSPWPGTCRTQHRISFDHRSTPQLSLFIQQFRALRSRPTNGMSRLDSWKIYHSFSTWSPAAAPAPSPAAAAGGRGGVAPLRAPAPCRFERSPPRQVLFGF